MQNSVHFFVPVYFDVKAFIRLKEAVLRHTPAPWRPVFHVLDDSAGTDPEVKQLAGLPELNVVATPRNLGHQGALVWGIKKFLLENSGHELILTLDADGQDRPEDLPRLIAAYREEALVLAQRTSREESALFQICYFFFKHAFRLLTGTVIRTGNFALYSTETARALLSHPHFDYTYGSSLVAHGKNLVYVPCPRGARLEGRSKMNYARLLSHGLRMFVPFKDRVRQRVLVAGGQVFFLVLVALLLWGLAFSP